MKSTLLLLLFSFIYSISIAQSNCDSLETDCCNFQLLGQDTITLQAKNNNTMEIFDYPGFKLINAAGDTVARETVNYFGIGWSWQEHVLQVESPINFPFIGTIELWGLFYDTLYCTYPITIQTAGIDELELSMEVFPNPASDDLTIEGLDNELYTLFNLLGEQVAYGTLKNGKLSVRNLESGQYILSVRTSNGILTKQITVAR